MAQRYKNVYSTLKVSIIESAVVSKLFNPFYLKAQREATLSPDLRDFGIRESSFGHDGRHSF